MLRKVLGIPVLTLGLVEPTGAQPVADPGVRKGIQQVEDGDYDAAILTLDGAARRLGADPGKARELSQAYLYLGIAYVGKGHEAAAKAKFREAVKQSKDLSLSPDKYPPRVIDLLEAAKEEVRQQREPQPSATSPPSSGDRPPDALFENKYVRFRIRSVRLEKDGRLRLSMRIDSLLPDEVRLRCHPLRLVDESGADWPERRSEGLEVSNFKPGTLLSPGVTGIATLQFDSLGRGAVEPRSVDLAGQCEVELRGRHIPFPVTVTGFPVTR